MSIADFALIIGIADKIAPQIGVDFFVTIAPPVRHDKVKIVGRTIHPALPLFFLKDQCLRLRRNRIFLHQIMNNP